MTDNDIIKALECCANADCINCPKWSAEWYSGMCADFLPMVFDLINRQKAEIEMLEEHNNILIDRVDNLVYECDCAKQEAIKEFAERLGEGRLSNDPVVIAAKCLVKEMAEDHI